MEVSFESKELREIFENENESDRRLGIRAGMNIRARYSDLVAAESFFDILIFCDKEKLVETGTIQIKVNNKLSIIAVLINPTIENDIILYQKSRRIKLIELIHEKHDSLS